MNDLALGLFLTVIAYSENRIVVVTREAVVASVSYSSDEYNIGLTSRRSNVYFTSQGNLAALDRKSLGSKIGVNVDLTILKSTFTPILLPRDSRSSAAKVPWLVKYTLLLRLVSPMLYSSLE